MARYPGSALLLRVHKPANLKQLLFGTRYERALRRAFAACVAVGIHDPLLNMTLPLRTYGLSLRRRLPWTKFRMLGTHTAVQKPLDGAARRAKLEALKIDHQINLPADRLIALVPSRIDFRWKGHDQLAQALQNKKISKEMHFVFCGWGEDYPRLAKLAEDNQWSVTFLKYVFSKPVLYEMMSACDIVVDNFVSGHYGATGAEAMGRGTPVMMWCDKRQYTHPPGIPPVLNARSSAQIEATLLDCLEGRLDLKNAGEAAYEWAVSRHSAHATVSMLEGILGGWEQGELQPEQSRLNPGVNG